MEPSKNEDGSPDSNMDESQEPSSLLENQNQPPIGK